MDKLKLQTPNIVDENILKIGELFPNCVVESKDDEGNIKKSIDFDLLKQELSDSVVEGAKERYQLNWPGKEKASNTAYAPIEKTLRPCREESVDFDKTKNLFIEGDNLDVLKLLQETYLGKVKMIYIDPPYNTGNDFIYKDNFRHDVKSELEKSGQIDDLGKRLITNPPSNGRFHSDWLSMMYPRLKLARNLLRDDGVIFISIDDNEVDNLRKLCDEIFGERNFVACLTWVKKEKTSGVPPKNKSIPNKEYIVVYEKQEDFYFNGVSGSKDSYRQDKKGNYYRTMPIQATGKQDNYFDIINPKNGNKHYGNWAFSEKRIKEMIKKNLIVFPQKEHQKPTQIVYYDEEKKSPIFHHIGHYDSEKQTKKFKGEFPSINFDFPKPLSLLEFILKQSTTKSAIVLDFFAGSGTTAHAVLALNKEDGGNRKYIMVQLPEPCDEKSEAFKEGLKTIADIGKERIRLAGKKIKEQIENKNKQKNLLEDDSINADDLDIGFRVLKVDSSNMEDVYYRPDEITQQKIEGVADNIKADRTPEDILFQVLLSWGVDLSLPIRKEKLSGIDVFFVDDDALAACFVKDGEVTEELCREIAERKPLRVIFRDSGFEDDSVKINVEQIFKLKSPETDIKTI